MKNQFTVRDLIWVFIVTVLCACMIRQENRIAAIQAENQRCDEFLYSQIGERVALSHILLQESFGPSSDHETDVQILTGQVHSLQAQIQQLRDRPSLAPEIQQLHVLVGNLQERTEVGQ